MVVADVSLLAPSGLLACALALVPVVVLWWTARRQQRTAAVLRLVGASPRRLVHPGVLAVAACVLLGVALAQPVLTTTQSRVARTSSEVVFVADVSQSMRASVGRDRPARIDEARAVIGRLRGQIPGVPAGISGLTDRVLPFVFPTLDRSAFSETLVRSVRVDSPPPQDVSTVATTYSPLASLVADGFYSRTAEHRTCVLVTDGETRDGAGDVGSLAGRRGCRLVVVRVGTPADRIYDARGRVDAAYRPEPSGATSTEQLARVAGGSVFTSAQLAAAGGAVAAAADVGPQGRVGVETSVRSLAPYLAVVSLLCVTLLLTGTGRGARYRAGRYGAGELSEPLLRREGLA